MNDINSLRTDAPHVSFGNQGGYHFPAALSEARPMRCCNFVPLNAPARVDFYPITWVPCLPPAFTAAAVPRMSGCKQVSILQAAGLEPATTTPQYRLSASSILSYACVYTCRLDCRSAYFLYASTTDWPTFYCPACRVRFQRPLSISLRCCAYAQFIRELPGHWS